MRTLQLDPADQAEPTWILTNVVPIPGHGGHIYVSPACMHGRHDRCGTEQLARGDMSPPHCTFCDSVCACLRCRHADQGERERRLPQQPQRVRRPGSAP